MAPHAYRAALVGLFLSLVSPAWGDQYYLYSPRPVTPEEAKEAKDGILVREMEVRQGDTLSGISHRSSGHGGYYPQILLFNDIKNPNLIHTGDTLRIPVAKGHPADAAEGGAPVHMKKRGAHKAGRKHKTHNRETARPEQSPVTTAAPSQLPEMARGEQKASGGSKRQSAPKAATTGRKPAVAQETTPAAAPKAQGTAGTDAAAGQRLFERAVKAYRQDDCHAALDLFDRFLITYPTLPQAADASLYKADCYLKLSAQ
jgi:LysM repeat protein